MKKLILASVAGNIIHRAEHMFPVPFNELQIGLITTASKQFEDKSWLEKEIDNFKRLSITLEVLDIENKNEEELYEILKTKQAIWVSGGNAYFLLYHTRKSGFDNVIKRLVQDGVVYIGSSAGAMLVCPNIDIGRKFDEPEVVRLDSYDGLKLVDYIPMPHVDQEEYLRITKEVLTEWKDAPYEIIGLTDYQALLVEDNYSALLDVSRGVFNTFTAFTKKFQRTREDFTCKHCNKRVVGDGYTNHCPSCLWGKHVDINPGDRREGCAGMMEPIDIEIKRGEQILIHKCVACGKVRKNKIQKDDDQKALLQIMQKKSELYMKE